MKSQSNYELLKDIYEVVERVEAKLDVKINSNEVRINVLETKTEQMFGKIGVVVALLTMFIAGSVNFAFDWIKSKI